MSRKRVLVVGATGAIGRPLCARLREEGHEVFGTHHAPGSAEVLRRMGVTPLAPDVFDRDEVERAFDTARPEVVIHQLTSLPRELNPRALAAAGRVTARLRRVTVPLFAQLCASAGARLISQSMSFVTRPEGAPVLDEDAPLWLDGPASIATTNHAIRVLEDATLEAGGLALRYGFFYGPGTWYAHDSAVTQMVRARKMPITGSGKGLWSFIHIDDAVDATARAVTQGPSGIYNICDDAPVAQNEWLPELARILEAKRPFRAPAWLVGVMAGPAARFYGTGLRGASNAKAKRVLGITPRSWRSGFSEEFAGTGSPVSTREPD